MVGVLLAMALAQGQDPVEIEAQLRRAKNEYAYGNYKQAIEQLRALMYPMKLLKDEQVIDARKYLALSHFLHEDVASANEEFGKLLYLAPDYELDPYTIAPPVIELFESIRTKMKPELDAIRQRAKDERLKPQLPRGIVRTIERTYYERSDVLTLMPFGAGQFQNGDTGLGSVFLGTELGLLAVNVTSYVLSLALGNYAPEERWKAQALLVTQYASAGLLGVAWSIGVVQARANFQSTAAGPRMIREEPIPVSGQLGGAILRAGGTF